MIRSAHVTMDNLIKRVNRKLAPQGRKLKVPRSWRMKANCGSYYILDLRTNTVIECRVNVESFARDLGVLADAEKLYPCDDRQSVWHDFPQTQQ